MQGSASKRSDFRLLDEQSMRISEDLVHGAGDKNGVNQGTQSQISFMLDDIDVRHPEDNKSRMDRNGGDFDFTKEKRVNFDNRLKSSINFAKGLLSKGHDR